MFALWFPTFNIQNYEKIWSLLLSHPVCGILLWQPGQTTAVHLQTLSFLLKQCGSNKGLCVCISHIALLHARVGYSHWSLLQFAWSLGVFRSVRLPVIKLRRWPDKLRWLVTISFFQVLPWARVLSCPLRISYRNIEQIPTEPSSK